MLFLFYVSNNAIAVSTATVLIASVFQHHFGESDYDVPFPKVTVEIDTQAFGPFISNLEQRKDNCHFQHINCQDDKIWCSSYCVFPPKTINRSWILVAIRIHQRYDVPLKFFHHIHIWPKINICFSCISNIVYEKLLSIMVVYFVQLRCYKIKIINWKSWYSKIALNI